MAHSHVFGDDVGPLLEPQPLGHFSGGVFGVFLCCLLGRLPHLRLKKITHRHTKKVRY